MNRMRAPTGYVPPAGLPRFLALYGTLFAAFGVASPFFAAFLAGRGLRPEAIGLVLAFGTATRLAGGPIGGRLADRLHAPRLVLTICAALAACIAFAYLPADGLLPLLLVSVAHALVLAPITPIADALALEAATVGGFEYGWVRGAGSATFILGDVAGRRGGGAIRSRGDHLVERNPARGRRMVGVARPPTCCGSRRGLQLSRWKARAGWRCFWA